MRLSDFGALTFDCYGTLIDWETGMRARLEPWARRHGIERTGDEMLEMFNRIEHDWESAHPTMSYPALLANTHRDFARALGAPADDSEAEAFGASIGDWLPFPDSVDALARLKRHYKLVILSNVNKAGIAKSAAHLGNPFDLILTAEEIGSYKPARRNFEVLIERVAALGVPKERILHTAQSLFHDHVPANEIGLKSAWIDRRAGKKGVGATVAVSRMPHLDFRFETLGAMADAREAEALQDARGR
ncbi:MAG: haloacid dehalogenase type II [Alphaproteobacteria bacterium]